MSFAMKFCLCFGLFRSFHLCLSTTLGSVHGWTCVRICVKETAGGIIIINYYFFSWKISTPKSTTFSIKLLTVHRQSSPYTNNKFHFHFHEANERKKHDKADESAAKWTRKKLIFYLDVFFFFFHFNASMPSRREEKQKENWKIGRCWHIWREALSLSIPMRPLQNKISIRTELCARCVVKLLESQVESRNLYRSNPSARRKEK